MSRKATEKSMPKEENPELLALRQQITHLTLENETLRNFIAERCPTVTPTLNTTRQNIEKLSPGTPKTGRRGCGCKSKGNCSTRVCGCRKKNVPCGQFCKCGDQCQNAELDKENIRDANKANDNNKKLDVPILMEPLQLKQEIENYNKEEAKEDSAKNSKKDAKDEPAEPEELKQTVVEDWNRHIASLVECSKCGRKLYPYRIKKHETFCKKV